jgi:hypothetical protein
MFAGILPCAICALRMHGHGGVGIEFALLLDMIRSNSVVHMASTHHQPQPVDGLLLLLQQFRRVEAEIDIRKKKQRLTSLGMFQDMEHNFGRVRRRAAVVALRLHVQISIHVTDDDAVRVLALPLANFVDVGVRRQGTERA